MTGPELLADALWALPVLAAALALRQGLRRRRTSALAALCWSVALAGIAVTALRFADEAAASEEARRRGALVRATALAADQIPVADLAALARDASDYGKPEYQRLVAYLRRIAARFPDAKFVYIMERDGRPGRLRFVADATPPEASGHSAPGEPYAGDGLPDFLASGLAAEVAGPFIDEYGHLVTGQVRLDGTPPDRPAMLGIDFDAAEWLAAVDEHRLEQIALGLATQILLALSYLPLHVQATANLRLRRQGALLSACAHAAETLAGTQEPVPATQRILPDLAAALGCDAAGLLALVEDQEPALVVRAGWDTRDGGGAAILSGPLLPAFARWPAAFRTGQPVTGAAAAAPAAERERLLAVGVRSLTLVPVRVEGRSWGCLAFIDRTQTRIRATADLSALGIVADAIGAALARQRMTADLDAARRRAEDAARAKGEFLASMTHEIRTPLNGILGMAGLLVDARLPGDLGEHAATIRSSGESLLTIINDILDLAKTESEHLELERTPFSPRTAIEDAAVLLAEKAQAKGLDLAVRIASGVPDRLLGDPGRLRQIALNLIGNAVKFTDAGEIVVGFAPAMGSDRYELTVTDTGIGMDPATIERLFRPFTQADASTTRRFGGTGLGLAICRRLAELMGGGIEVVSAPGRGTTMRVLLPLPTVEGDTAQHRRRRVGGPGLAVVPHAATREALTDLLERTGMAVTAVADPAAAAGLRADLLLWDTAAGDAAACRAVAAACGAARVVWLAPMALRVAPADIQTAQVAAVLRKPVRRRILLEALESDPVSGAHAQVGTATLSFPGRRVLIVDDNPANLRLASIILEHHGCRVDTAASGVEAVAAHARTPYDLILMDCLMPEMDGWTAARAIRAQETGRKRIPIVAVTANTPDDEQERCRAAGMDGVIGKPLRQAELLALLDRMLQPARTLRDDTVAALGGGDLRTGLERIALMWDGAIAPLLARIQSEPGGDGRLAALRELASLAGTFGLDALAAAARSAEEARDDETRWEDAAAGIQRYADRSRSRIQRRIDELGRPPA